MDEDKGRSARFGEQGTVRFVKAMGRKPSPGGTIGRLQGRSRSIDHSNGDESRDVAPVLPAMKVRQIVRPHDPDESHARAAPGQPGDGVIGVAGANLRLEAGDDDAGMVGEFMGCSHARGERRQAVVLLEGIAGGDEPPDLVEPQPRHGDGADEAVPLVGWIEGPAEEADAHARSVGRKAHGSAPAIGGRWNGNGPSSYAHFRQNDGSRASAQGGSGKSDETGQKLGLNRSRRPTPWTESFGCMERGGANARRPFKGEGFAREPAKPP